MRTKEAKFQLATRISMETQAQMNHLLYCYDQAGDPHSIQQIVEAALLLWCTNEQRRMSRKGSDGVDG